MGAPRKTSMNKVILTKMVVLTTLVQHTFRQYRGHSLKTAFFPLPSRKQVVLTKISEKFWYCILPTKQGILLRRHKSMKMTIMAGVAQAKWPFAKSTVLTTPKSQEYQNLLWERFRGVSRLFPDLHPEIPGCTENSSSWCKRSASCCVFHSYVKHWQANPNRSPPAFNQVFLTVVNVNQLESFRQL